MAVVPASVYGAPRPGDAAEPPSLPRGTTLLGTLLLIGADAMILAGLLGGWVVTRGGSGEWPPDGVNVNTYLPTVVTITAAMGAFTVQWVVSAIRRNDQRSGIVAIVLTVFLGAAIANAHWYSLTTAGFGVSDHPYGTYYHLLIGYHLVHVVLAAGALILVGARAIAGHFGRDDNDPLKSVAAFWQWGNVAWFVIMSAVFLFSRHS